MCNWAVKGINFKKEMYKIILIIKCLILELDGYNNKFIEINKKKFIENYIIE